MSTKDIHEQMKEIYGIEISAEMVSKMTDSIIPNIRKWQNRPLNPIYPFVFMDAIHYKVREDAQIKSKATYVVLGVDLDGFKDILEIWIGQNESSKFLLGVLNDFKNRGIKEVLIFSVDGLTGLKEAILATYPTSEVQRYIIHQLRNSFKYVGYKHLNEFSSDFKSLYKAINEEESLENLAELEEK